jgi:serine O-acetyltransferase
MDTTNLIKTDFRRHIAYIRVNKTNRNHFRNYGLFFSLFLMDTGFRGILLHRIVHSFCSESRFRLYTAYFFYRILTSIEISPRAQIGHGLFFPHPQCIVIGNAILGDNCTVYHGVTIGAKLPFHEEYPKIGDNVYIGKGSTILGDVSIGNNVTIGANSMVLEDIPDNSVVIGNPAKIIRKTK